ncbi:MULTISPECIES: DUF3397 domain-containing protein [Peribacillus]|uniref:DUF3397 domain-containing protein n=1 Tax=Peribacillus simplex TaxID=1478 RepID=A0A109MSW9_9BACI|nr:DUF3397 domain-containing protein [Peribacillus simplex]KWW11558.1 hypothetical protein AS888_00850 [Peribacillus simplex]
MPNVVSSLVAIFITLPFVGYILFFIGAKQFTGNHRRSVQFAMDMSALLFVISVHYLIIAIWDKHILWVIMLIMIVNASVVVMVHYKVKEEIIFHKVVKGFWRVNFAFFFVAYILLFSIGLITSITKIFTT